MFNWFRKRPPASPSGLSPEAVATLHRNVWQYRWLPDDARERVQLVTGRMLAERTWEGGSGLAVTDEMRLTVAGVAALLTLGYEEVTAYERLPSIILYRGAYAGAVEGGVEGRLGEAWRRGPIVLSWPDVLRTARRAGCGSNLVLHEFAHHVDGLDGEMDGRPGLGRDDARRWETVANWEYDRLVARAQRREVTLLDHYGASNHAEFFAVSTECFFERPHDLRTEHAELYDLLSKFYRQDPTEWAPPAHRLARRRDAAQQSVVSTPDVSDLGFSPLDAAFTQGVELRRAGQHEEALAAFDLALQHDPEDAEALTLRAATRLDLEDYEGALADADKAIARDADQAVAHTAAAEALIELDDDVRAEKHARTALRLDRDNLDAVLFCGMLALRRGRVSAARRLLKRLVLLDRYWDEAHHWLASAHEQAGDHEAARHHYARAQWLAAQPPEEAAEDADESES